MLLISALSNISINIPDNIPLVKNCIQDNLTPSALSHLSTVNICIVNATAHINSNISATYISSIPPAIHKRYIPTIHTNAAIMVSL